MVGFVVVVRFLLICICFLFRFSGFVLDYIFVFCFICLVVFGFVCSFVWLSVIICVPLFYFCACFLFLFCSSF